jgi:Zn-finger nucleic acid-binding protein
MPHLKCSKCQIRIVEPREQDASADNCPRCGETFEPVGSLTEIMGFRLLTTKESPAPGPPLSTEGIRRIDARLAEMGRVGRWTAG